MEATTKEKLESDEPIDGSPLAVNVNSEANRVTEVVDQNKFDPRACRASLRG